MSIRVCVLMTSFERCRTTLACLSALAAQDHPDAALEVFLVDDGSSDGTGDAVRREFPTVSVIGGTGSLYWGGGTRLADAAAWATSPDYLLWLNDDVRLAGGAIASLVSTARAAGGRTVVVGSLSDPITGALTYGGYRQRDRRRALDLEPVTPGESPQAIDTMNGNLVLIPAPIRTAVGPPDARFSHNMADMDFGFRVRAAGFGIILAPGFLGTCARNRTKARWSDPTVPLVERLRAVGRFDGLPPREWWVFTRRHCGLRWPRYFLGPYLRSIAAGPAARWAERRRHRAERARGVRRAQP